MLVNSVGQENRVNNTAGALGAGVGGAVAGTLLAHVGPLTTQEYADYFTPSAKDGIQKAARKARGVEIENIQNELKGGRLNIVSEANDLFQSSKGVLKDEPQKLLDIVADSPDEVKRDIKTITKRVEKAGKVVEQRKTAGIKAAAKDSRPLGKFALIGAAVGVCAAALANALTSKKQVEENKEKEPLTMADILLEGLGPNTEFLYLVQESRKSK